MLSYHIDPVRGIVEVVGQETEPDEFDTLLAEVLTDPRFRLGFGFLRDRRGHDPPTMGLVRRRVGLVRHLRAIAISRWAIIVTPADLDRDGSSAMGTTLAADGAEVRVFTDPEAAAEWLACGSSAKQLLND